MKSYLPKISLMMTVAPYYTSKTEKQGIDMFISQWFYKSILLGILIWLVISLGATQALAAPPTGPPIYPGYVRADLLNVRFGPGLSYGVVTTARYGEQVNLLARTASADWLKIRLSTGQEGWAVVRYIEVSPDALNSLPVLDQGTPPSTGPTAKVAVHRLNVRGGPGLNYNVIATLRWGETRLLVGRSADCNWLQIRLPDTLPTFAEPTGWVLARYVWHNIPIHILPVTDGGTPPPNNLWGIVTVPRLNARSGPGLGYGIVGQVYQGQQIQALGRSTDRMWLKVAWGPNNQAWVYAPYVSIVGPF
jgi:uncharacterized protein YgiM (DUF1202 family)